MSRAPSSAARVFLAPAGPFPVEFTIPLLRRPAMPSSPAAGPPVSEESRHLPRVPQSERAAPQHKVLPAAASNARHSWCPQVGPLHQVVRQPVPFRFTPSSGRAEHIAWAGRAE